MMRIGRAELRWLSLMGATLLSSPLGAQSIDPLPGGLLDDRLGIARETPGASVRQDPTLRLPGTTTGDVTALPAVGDPNGIDRGTTVSARRRPQYDPAGVRTGSFLFFPELTAGVGYEDNVYSEPNGRGDIYGRLRASGALRSTWGVHALAVDGYVDQRSYAKYDTEDAFTYGASASGKFDIDRTASLTGGVSHSRQVVDRSAVGEILTTRRPVRYDLTGASAGFSKDFGRLAVGVTGAVDRFDFLNARTQSGDVSDQQFRDYTRYSGGVEGSYGFGSGPRLYAAVNGELRRYRVQAPPITRDADIVEGLVGIRSEITPLIRGRLGVGYLHANFKDPTIPSQGALAIDANLDYLFSELTTFRLSARRYFQNVGLITAPATLNTEVQLRVDHELLRNVILSANARYVHGKYVDEDAAVNRWNVGVGGLWLVNRRIRMDAALDYTARKSDRILIGNQKIDAFRASVGVRYHL
ncbi:outer membrane beta-barrel protein [Sphingomonas montana]|uniref:outer membrane beta-barrel protein n=1 Tax=Sphingomonas montana TaxID=1843236 RepID=UPI00096F58E0|nr:outer membrane beta-barrel protein [Sphingomonas montana]